MCGLLGALAFGGGDDDLVTPVRALTRLIARRGPDDEGVWTDGKVCALGFRRLAILDRSSAGHQPMVSPGEAHALVFNGEIYNFREIRDELAARGRTPRSTGDAEVLFLALQEWGVDALRRLNGMYALAFYDARTQTLLLARDHAGIKPLHYARTSRGVVFGSQHDVLLGHPWMRDAGVDRASLGLYLRFGFVPAPYGLHTGTRQLAAGEWVEIDATGAMRSGSSSELPREQSSLRGAEAIEAIDAAIVRAVRRQLVSDVPLGVFLSGGVDSPLVAAVAAAQRAEPLEAFTIEVDDPALNEAAEARRYAQAAGLRHVVERVTADDVGHLLDDVIAAATEPTADYSMFPTVLVSRVARRRVTVALSGDGGDELFWGYPSRFGTTIAQARYFALPRPLRLAAVAARRTLGIGAATRDVLAFPTVGRLYQRKHTLMAEADLARVFPELPALPVDFDVFACDATDPDRVASWTRANEYRFHLARVLAKVDRASMHESLEVRVPLLDREVIETAWRVDWRTCFDLATRTGKLPLRRLLERRAGAATPGKRGFEVPMYRWLTTSLRDRVHELLLGRSELLGLPVTRGAIADLYARLEAGDRSKAWGLWLLLSLALWQRAHGRR